MKPILTLLLLALAIPAGAADMPVPGFTGAIRPQLKVKSLREARFANVIEQKTDFSCGAATLATILRYAYGLDAPEEVVLKGMMGEADQETVRKLGFSMLDMKRYVEALGFRSKGYKLPLEALPALKIPAITLLDTNGYKHFVVVRKATADTVYVADPSVGNRAISMEEFASQWSGVLLAVVGQGYRVDNPLVRVAPALSARSGINAAQPVPTAELIEYGFLHSDFF
ncbi:C39 family peptidase [Jeongeupia sp. USM3]|uniref:C39 family peptidase n=1 Tax=Jeongeupia sp. USM3 TaxID=1906741 RepID=UPI00089E0516|nr:C39 family peptidase [Jeongeupia sp. USM3]AOY00603.1 peptidase C39 [Jeongeupia sp. USM3]